MEKIQQALEKARNERGSPLRGHDDRQPRPTAARVEPPPIEAVNCAPSGASCSRTRIIPASGRHLRRQRIISSGDAGAVVDVFRVLRTQVLMGLEARQGNTLAICAAGQGEGKTTIAANLAITLARHQHRSALLVDLDLRRPRVAACFGIVPEAGLSDYLEGNALLEDCLVSPGIERLVLLPQRRKIAESSELLASPRMRDLSQELKRRYPDRVVIYDCPPLLVTDDALVALRYADGCLMVAREGMTTREKLARAADLVEDHWLLGTVLNDARWSMASGYYRNYEKYA